MWASAYPGELNTGSPTWASEATPFFERLWICAQIENLERVPIPPERDVL
jgi:hypothetical protein